MRGLQSTVTAGHHIEMIEMVGDIAISREGMSHRITREMMARTLRNRRTLLGRAGREADPGSKSLSMTGLRIMKTESESRSIGKKRLRMRDVIRRRRLLKRRSEMKGIAKKKNKSRDMCRSQKGLNVRRSKSKRLYRSSQGRRI